jgi:predicted nuclease with TOPRIM domain
MTMPLTLSKPLERAIAHARWLQHRGIVDRETEECINILADEYEGERHDSFVAEIQQEIEELKEEIAHWEEEFSSSESMLEYIEGQHDNLKEAMEDPDQCPCKRCKIRRT